MSVTERSRPSAAPRPAGFLCTACDAEVTVPPFAGDPPVVCTTCGRQYGWQDGVLMLGTSRDPDHYPEQLHALLAAVEPRHFWFRERNRLIIATLRKALGSLRGVTVLDIGCGAGYMTGALETAGCDIWGLDMNQAGLKHARTRMRGPLLCEDAARVPFREAFEVALLCDVIEHTSDDRAVLRETRGALRPGGLVVVTVPAHAWLWTPVDDASGHYRRYTVPQVRRALQDAGFEVTLARYFNSLLLPVQALQRLVTRGTPLDSPSARLALVERALRVPPEPLNTALGLLAAVDPLLARLPFSFGASIIAIGRVRAAAWAKRPSTT